MKIVFFNSGNGDIHYLRQFVKDIIKKKGNDFQYVYAHVQSPDILCDIKELKTIQRNDYCMFENTFTEVEQEDALYISTWIGQQGRKFIMDGINIKGNYELFKIIYEKLGITLDENIDNYIPTIDFNYVYKKNVNVYLKDNNNFKVLISNGDTRSGQSQNFSFDYAVDILSKKYNNVDFILTHNTYVNRPNVYLTKDLIQKDNCDLNEIAYLSTFCNFVVGRSSGPYCFCEIYENIMNKNKTFLNISMVDHWCNGDCEQIITNDYVNFVNIMDEIIRKKS